MSSAITCLIFDLGGVLVRLDYMKWCRAVGRLAGVPAEQVAGLALDSGLGREFDRGGLTPSEFVASVRDRLPFSVDDEVFRRIWVDIFERDRRMEALAARLAARYPLVMLSNVNVWHYEHLARVLPLFEHFHALVLSFREGLLKPDPRIYKKAAAAGDAADLSACLYVDDVMEYVEAAAALGMTAVRFEGCERLAEQLAAAGIDP